jgi:hypothetical protein
MPQQGVDVLADVVASGSGTESLGTLFVIGKSRADHLLEIASVEAFRQLGE